MLTLPKSLDQPIIVIDKPSDPAIRPSLRWSTPREFITQASSIAVRNSIFVPPLFRPAAGEQTTSNAITPTALGWSLSVMRRMGREIEMFDSLYAACNYYESSQAHPSSDPQLRDMVMFYVEQAMSSARTHNTGRAASWGGGLFEHFDFHVASAILSFRYHVSIVDVLREMEDLGLIPQEASSDIKRTYSSACNVNDWSPSEFVNEAARHLALVESGSHEQFFMAKNHVRPAGTGDEYRAVIALINREIQAESRVFVPSEFERDVLRVQFASSQLDSELTEQRVSHA